MVMSSRTLTLTFTEHEWDDLRARALGLDTTIEKLIRTHILPFSVLDPSITTQRVLCLFWDDPNRTITLQDVDRCRGITPEQLRRMCESDEHFPDILLYDPLGWFPQGMDNKPDQVPVNLKLTAYGLELLSRFKWGSKSQ